MRMYKNGEDQKTDIIQHIENYVQKEIMHVK